MGPVIWRWAKITSPQRSVLAWQPNPLALAVWILLFAFVWFYSFSGDARLAADLGLKTSIVPLLLLLASTLVNRLLLKRRDFTVIHISVSPPQASLRLVLVLLVVFSLAGYIAARLPTRAPKPPGGFFYRPPTAIEGAARLALVAMILATSGCGYRVWHENRQLRKSLASDRPPLSG